MNNFKYLIISNYDSYYKYDAYDHTGHRPDIAKIYHHCSTSWWELDEDLRNTISFNEYVTTMIKEHYDLVVFCEDGTIDILKFYEDEN